MEPVQTDAPLILLINDDSNLRAFLQMTLAERGYRVDTAEDGPGGLVKARAQPPDLVLLDVDHSEMDGLTIMRQMRSWSKIPVVVLSKANQEMDKVAVLDAGADDYLSKPVGVDELLARVRVALRHRVQEYPDAVYSVGDLRIDLGARRVFLRGEAIHLTPTEYRILTTMARNAGRVLSHSYLLKKIWGSGSVDDREYLRVFMASLRRKLEANAAQPRYLLTEPGIGYRMTTE